MNYKHYKVNLADIDIQKIKGASLNTFGSFYEYELADKNWLDNYLANKILFSIKPDMINFTEIGYPGTPVHTDNWKCALNFYLETTGEETVFYDVINNKGEIIDIPFVGLKDYNNRKLSIKETLVVKQFDCILLNTTVPHTVTVTTKDTRKILRFIWQDVSFSDVAQSIKII